jgi:hypothetical protein
MSNNNPSPFSEAVSIIAILSGLAALGCYTAGSQNASVLTPALLWLAGCIYDWFPAMNRLQTPQAPLLVASAAAGLLCFLALLPLAFWLGNVFSQLGSMDRQAAWLKRHQAKVRKGNRDREDFLVS